MMTNPTQIMRETMKALNAAPINEESNDSNIYQFMINDNEFLYANIDTIKTAYDIYELLSDIMSIESFEEMSGTSSVADKLKTYPIITDKTVENIKNIIGKSANLAKEYIEEYFLNS